MFNCLAYAKRVSKPLSIYVKLGDEDEEKVKNVTKIINQNFDLSPRGIREILGLNKPIYQISSCLRPHGRNPTKKGVNFLGKPIKPSLFKL